MTNLYMLCMTSVCSPSHWAGTQRFKPVALFRIDLVGHSSFLYLKFGWDMYTSLPYWSVSIRRYSQLLLIHLAKGVYTKSCSIQLIKRQLMHLFSLLATLWPLCSFFATAGSLPVFYLSFTSACAHLLWAFFHARDFLSSCTRSLTHT